jgi:hypothetical protein
MAFNLTKMTDRSHGIWYIGPYVYSLENEEPEFEKMRMLGSTCGENILTCGENILTCGYSFTSDCV